MAGLLETLQNLRFNPSPLSTGLMLGGANMMQAGGPSLHPQNFGSAMGAGLQGLLQGYVGARETDYERERQKQEFELDQLYKRAQLEQLQNPNKFAAATPGQWYYPPGSTPFKDPETGFNGYKTPQGALIPLRSAMTDYQQAMTDPAHRAAIRQAEEAKRVVKAVDENNREYYAPTENLTGTLPPIIPNQIQVESGGDVNAVSPKGARGATQIMPATAQNPGFGVEPMRDDSVDEQLRFQSDYMRALTKYYAGDVKKALSAYNAGPGNVDRNGIINAGYVDKVMGQGPVKGPSMQEQSALKAKEAGNIEFAKAKGEQAATAENKLRVIDNRLEDLDQAIEALKPSKNIDKISGLPSEFGFRTGGFLGGSGITPTSYYEMTNDPSWRTLQRVGKGEELIRASDDMAKQGQITEAERALLSLATGLDPAKVQTQEMYKMLVQARQRLNELKTQWSGNQVNTQSPDDGGVNDPEYQEYLKRFRK